MLWKFIQFARKPKSTQENSPSAQAMELARLEKIIEETKMAIAIKNAEAAAHQAVIDALLAEQATLEESQEVFYEMALTA